MRHAILPCCIPPPTLSLVAMSPIRLCTTRISQCFLAARIAPARSFASTPVFTAKPLPPRRVIFGSEIEENFLKGTGPGGQKINKTSSAVQLKHLPTGIVVKCQLTRSRSQNRKMARQQLGEKLEELELGDAARTRVRARERGKKKASADKKKRRKYRALAEANVKDGEDGEREAEADQEDDEQGIGAKAQDEHENVKAADVSKLR